MKIKMKARLLLVLAAAAMVFTACRKDSINDNEIIYNGITYHMQNVTFNYFDSAQGTIIGNSAETGPEGTPEVIIYGISVWKHLLDKPCDLVQIEDEGIYLSIGGETTSLKLRFDWIWRGWIGEEYYKDGIFSRGTQTVTKGNDGLVYTLDGTLKNGDTIKIRLVIPGGGFDPWRGI